MKKYTREEVRNATLAYFDGDELAADVFFKYCLTDGKNYYEKTPDDMHRRLAREFARIESKYPNAMSEDEIYGYLKDFRYIIPQGSPMSAIGNPYRIESTSNCVVVSPPVDSYGGILYVDQLLVQACKRRCGVGFDISNIRPKGLPTKNASGTTDGIGIFMERYSNSTREVAQSGRRGALMISLSVHHPEIRKFISIKDDKTECRKCGHEERTRVTGANVSVRLTDEFLNAAKNNKKFQLRWPVESDDPDISEKCDAKELWDDICKMARDSSEPGLMFWNNVKKYCPSESYEGYRSTSSNPCSEIFMGSPDLTADSCRLLLVNLLNFVNSPFTKGAEFDFEKFFLVSKKAQKLMDDLVDIESEHIDRIIEKIEKDPEDPKIKQIEKDHWIGMKRTCEEARRTGLGITALGDTIASLGIKYGTEESIEIAEKIYKTLCLGAYYSSCEMARDRGPFKIYSYEKEKNNSFIKRVMKEDKKLNDIYKKYGRRNIALLTTAPTGSTSILARTSSGIEPVYLLKYNRSRKVRDGEKYKKIDANGDKWIEYVVYHNGLKKWMEITGDKEIEKSPYFGSTAYEIDWLSRVKLQASCQKWVDHSISSTVNLPEDVSWETVQEIYEEAWKSGVKGITVYREGSRDGVLTQISEDNKSNGMMYEVILEDGSIVSVEEGTIIEYNDKRIKVEDLKEALDL